MSGWKVRGGSNFILLILLVSSFTLSASDLTTDLMLGFNGSIKLGSRAPVSVSLINSGKEISGELKLELKQGSLFQQELYTVTYSRKIELPANSRKRYFFVLPFKSFTLPLRVSITSADQRIFEREIDLKQHLSREQLILVLSRRISLDFLKAFSAEPARVIYPHPEYLPESWNGYEGVDLLVLHDISLAHIRPVQVRAIEEWLYSGGRLVITGGVHILSRDNSPIKELMPVELLGIEVLDRPGALELPEKLPVVDSRLISGKALLKEEDTPLIVRQKRGKGFIFFMAFDSSEAPLSDWPGKVALWQQMLSQESTGLYPDPGIEEKRGDAELLLSGLVKNPELKYPPHTVLLAFLLGYLGLQLLLIGGPLLKKRRPALKWLLVMSLSFLFAASGYYLFNQLLFREETALISLAVIEPSWQQGLARVKGELALISSCNRDYQLKIANKDTAVTQWLPGHKLKPAYSFEVRRQSDTAVLIVRMGELRARYFRLDTVIDLPIGGKIQEGDGIVTLRVENRSSFTISGAVLSARGSIFKIGALPPGVTKITTGSPLTGPAADGTVVSALIYGSNLQGRGGLESGMKEAMLESLRSRELADIMIIGWIKEQVLPIETEGSFLKRQNLSLVYLPINSDEVF
ncbi:MAG: hypothetical protein GH155_07460 [Spirochaeta sp.]|nr:hypothetical protein [Spirochaeta sp.]